MLYDARLSGWTDEEIDFPVIESSRTLSASGFPLPINIDIKLPPGFAGEVVEYINSQSIYPRKTLSSADVSHTLLAFYQTCPLDWLHSLPALRSVDYRVCCPWYCR